MYSYVRALFSNCDKMDCPNRNKMVMCLKCMAVYMQNNNPVHCAMNVHMCK